MAMPRGSAFRCAGGNVPQAVPDADAWQLIHLYAAAPAFDNGAAFDGTAQPKHYTQSAGLVAVHPVVYHLTGQFPCIVWTLRARSFMRFNHDPANYFAPQSQHDNCGFVLQE